MIALKHPCLFFVEVKRVAILPKRFNAPKQPFVQINLVGMTRENRRDLPLDLLNGVVCMGAGKIEENGSDAVEGITAFLHGRDGVVEARLGWISSDRFDFLAV
jgi:hypothetical protein